MEVVVQPSAALAIRLVARLVEDRVRQNSKTVLGLATGRTMEKVYKHLADCGVSFKHCQSFNLDEYIGLASDDPNTYQHYMQTHFFSHIDMEAKNTHIPNGCASDLEQAADEYEQLIKNSGGIDVQLLGIGEAGHIGFNEPLSSIMSRTRDKCLTPTTRSQNAEMFGGDPERVPARALTMGVGTILKARELILLATGKMKASIIAQAVEGPITSMVSASAIQLHPNCKVVVDEDAARKLKGREYYDFIFANEPKWAMYNT